MPKITKTYANSIVYYLFIIGIIRAYGKFTLSDITTFTFGFGQSWLQRNWRPITMVTFLFLVVMDSFGLLSFRLSSEAPQFGINVIIIADWFGWLCCWEVWREDSYKVEGLKVQGSMFSVNF